MANIFPKRLLALFEGDEKRIMKEHKKINYLCQQSSLVLQAEKCKKAGAKALFPLVFGREIILLWENTSVQRNAA